MSTAAVVLGLTLISGDVYASEEYVPLIQKAYKDRNDRYGQWNPYAVSGARLRDKKEWAVANAVIARNRTDSLKTIFKKYITSDFSSASPNELKGLVLNYLAKPEYALAHQFTKAQDYEGLATLLQITGPEILLIPDSAGKLPLQDVSSSDLSDFSYKMEPYLPTDGEIAKKLKAIFPTLLKENLEALINQITAFKKQHDAELKNEGRWGEKRKTLTAKEQEFNRCCEKLMQTPEGRKFLRDYRLPNKNSLISYYIKELQKDPHGDYAHSLQLALRFYFEDNVSITADVLDISDLDSLRVIMNNVRGAEASKILSQYRNRNGHNIAQLIFILEVDDYDKQDGLSRLRQIMQDNTAFLSLLRQTSSGTESAEEMLINMPWGMQTLERLDPAVLVRPGKYGVTPLMKEALHSDPESLLDYLKQHGVLVDPAQTDLFGNTVESIRRFVTSNSSFYSNHEEFLVESLKRRPLQESLWAEYFDFPYFATRRMHGSIEDVYDDPEWVSTRQLVSIGVLSIVRQQPQTPLHRAFWQVDIHHHQAEAKSLWRSLFKTFDDREDRDLAEWRAHLSKEQQRVKLLPAEDEEHQRLAAEMRELKVESERTLAKRIPLAERVLGVLSAEKDPDAVANMLASYGTFGINFSRKVSPLGGRIVMKKCQELGQHFVDKIQSVLEQHSQAFRSHAHIVKTLNDDFGLTLTETTLQSSIPEITEKLRERFKKPDMDLNVLFSEYILEKANIKGIAYQMLKDSFFQDFVSPLDSAQQKKLLNHRLNCAVMALSVKTKPMDGLPIDPLHKDQVFAEIDEELQSFVPAGQKVNSKARFERLNSLYGEVVE